MRDCSMIYKKIIEEQVPILERNLRGSFQAVIEAHGKVHNLRTFIGSYLHLTVQQECLKNIKLDHR